MRDRLIDLITDYLESLGYTVKLVDIPGYVPFEENIDFIGELHIKAKHTK